MSNRLESFSQAPASSGSSWQRTKVSGIPTTCCCGKEIVVRTSLTQPHPYRSFYRCSLAANEELKNDRHVFKWVDEAVDDELEKIRKKLKKISNNLYYQVEQVMKLGRNLDLQEEHIKEELKKLR